MPQSLPQYPNAKAELRAAGKRNNFLKALVGRIPPVAGVLAYELDVPIDLVGLAEAAAAPAPAEPPAPEPTPAPAP